MESPRDANSENTVPSSSSPAIFSDDATRPCSPPSSPPGFPWDYDNAPKAVPRPPQKSAFSVLGKRKALSPVSENARASKKAATAAKKSDGRPLMQMQISLGQEVQKRCKTCGMEYVVSSEEDRKMHDKYHKQSTEGYDVGKDFARPARDGAIFDGVKKEDKIHEVDSRDKIGRRVKAQAMLNIVQTELGAVEVDEDGIWDNGKPYSHDPKYRSYLYLRGTKCIGYLLIERIHDAREVVAPHASPPSAGDQSTSARKIGNAVSALQQRRQASLNELHQAQSHPIELSKTVTKAALGVSRIWTSSTHRRQNIAKALLDAALCDYTQYSNKGADATIRNEGHEDSEGGDKALQRRNSRGKELVAFSQPTDSGAKLARKWFGKAYGWKVYVD